VASATIPATNITSLPGDVSTFVLHFRQLRLKPTP
jgi:hypothetical protein